MQQLIHAMQFKGHAKPVGGGSSTVLRASTSAPSGAITSRALWIT